ncbi:hypothetical protein [Actinoplanes auranticolor]|uniref:Uncharacterized protein n=1 Tax=Actinoplanes auranticolor TaxID=47988 RepID=A0A919SA75_9ACTN|nr:hypothetical protein [Actinoplanes auranticolor]GIM67809.1 hypothetical protein Aau02nite_28940 [Actinoplanes auranticolor]
MNTVDDLRRTLEDQAGRAPDERGLIEGARAGAARIRRRRRVTAAAGTAAAVLVSALVVPFAVRHESAPPVAPSASSVSPVPAGPRRGSDLTVAFAPGKGLTVSAYTADTLTQDLMAVRDDGMKFYLHVSNPGTFGRDPIEGSKRVSVGDRDGWYLVRQSAGVTSSKPETVHSLLWETRDGFGLKFSSVSGQADLLATARAIRFVRPAPPSGPLQLGWVPDGLIPTSVDVRADRKTGSVHLLPPVSESSEDTGIFLSAEPVSPDWLTRWTEGAPPTHTIAGRQAWYRELPFGRRGTLRAILAVTAGDCGITVQATGPISFADLERLVGEATIGSCTSQDGWGPVVP